MNPLSYLGDIAKALLPFVWSHLVPWLSRVRITSPREGETVDDPHVTVDGDFWNTFGQRYILFHKVEDRYYPQGLPDFNRTAKTWTKDVHIGDMPINNYEIVLMTVSDEAYPVIDHYYNLAEDEDNYYPITLTVLPKGFSHVQTVTVKLANRT